MIFIQEIVPEEEKKESVITEDVIGDLDDEKSFNWIIWILIVVIIAGVIGDIVYNKNKKRK
jgi:hypothetical protein